MMQDYMKELPLIAILRGLTPNQAVDVGETIYDAGFRIMEVPLNSPDPFSSIALLVRHFGERMLIGAGTVTSAEDCRRVAEAGARLVVAPNTDADVIATACAADMIAVPGVATPSEAFAAIRAGANALKLFPADAVGPSGVRAWRAVLPARLPLIAVGGVGPDNMAEWRKAGVDGFGIGSALFRPGMTTSDIRRNADAFIAAFHTGSSR